MQTETLDQCILCDSKNIDVYDTKLCLSKCADCSLIFDNPRPTLEAISAYYSEQGKYDDWLSNEEGLNKQWRNLLKRIKRLKPEGDLLDIGAGIGQFLHFAKEHYTVLGTEVSSEAVHLAKEKFNIDLIQGIVEAVNLGDKKFDIITMHQVMEHVQFPSKTIEYCKSLLKPGGILYIGVPNEAAYSLRMIIPAMLKLIGRKKYKDFSIKGFRKIDFDSMNEIHLSHFSEQSLKKVLSKKGFKIVASNIDFIDPLIYSKWPVQIIRHIIFTIAVIIRLISRKNIYNCFWVAAKKSD